MLLDRAGKFVTQLNGYKAFIPKPLPPDPPLRYDEKLQFLLSEADRALARLEGVATVLSNRDLFVAIFAKKEALLSSQIEGIQASLEGILLLEANITPGENKAETKKVLKYIEAMNFGIQRIRENDFTLSSSFIKEIHKILIKRVRGSFSIPGEFRISQTWIGPPGASIKRAIFIHPPKYLLEELMSDLEKFILTEDKIPPLIKIALIHAQFETIHPFLEGNGRIGRLLITLYLFWKGILSRPLLYLSLYLKKNKDKYNDLLMRIRFKGDWERWLKFFLQGAIEASEEALSSAKEIIELKEDLIERLLAKKIGGIFAIKFMDILFEKPLISIPDIANNLRANLQTAINLVDKFQDFGILREITGKQRFRKYLFVDYIDIIARGTEI
ncbi:MAG: Fic family protein [Candidatus Aminicenantes bacterium]|nr:Fic family protein [Candidatus Aminicenantes bacterium]